jgi:hypothetical protein
MPHPRPWHRCSLFGPGPQHPLDREQRARFAFLIRAHHAAGRITRTARDIGMALLSRLGSAGQLDPAHGTLAADVACSLRTVGRAVTALRSVGLLAWQRRIVRLQGGQIEQTSCQFWLTASAAVPVPSPSSHIGRQRPTADIEPVVERDPGVLEALARQAVAGQARFAAIWAARKGR